MFVNVLKYTLNASFGLVLLCILNIYSRPETKLSKYPMVIINNIKIIMVISVEWEKRTCCI